MNMKWYLKDITLSISVFEDTEVERERIRNDEADEFVKCEGDFARYES